MKPFILRLVLTLLVIFVSVSLGLVCIDKFGIEISFVISVVASRIFTMLETPLFLAILKIPLKGKTK